MGGRERVRELGDLAKVTQEVGGRVRTRNLSDTQASVYCTVLALQTKVFGGGQVTQATYIDEHYKGNLKGELIC